MAPILRLEWQWIISLKGWWLFVMFKKYKGLTGLLLLIVCLLAFIPGQTAYAAGSYKVGNYDSTWVVQPNGDVKVTETIEFDILIVKKTLKFIAIGPM